MPQVLLVSEEGWTQGNGHFTHHNRVIRGGISTLYIRGYGALTENTGLYSTKAL